MHINSLFDVSVKCFLLRWFLGICNIVDGIVTVVSFGILSSRTAYRVSKYLAKSRLYNP